MWTDTVIYTLFSQLSSVSNITSGELINQSINKTQECSLEGLLFLYLNLKCHLGHCYILGHSGPVYFFFGSNFETFNSAENL